MDALPALLARLPAASPFSFELNSEPCLRLDLSEANLALRGLDPADTSRFSTWVSAQIETAGATYAAGGYGENRELYAMSPVFRTGKEEPRTVHLGIDLWLAAGTPIHAVLPGAVHSTADNAAFGDYGPTVVLEHHLGGRPFYTLYGHLSWPTLERMRKGQRVETGQLVGWLGAPQENGGWPSHLHFQVIRDMQNHRGDFPGVCRLSEREHWLQHCPDPNLLLRIDALR